MHPLYLSADEEAAHRQAMQQLAVQTGRPLAEIEGLWETHLAVLSEGARLRQYLPIFTLRAVREALAQPAVEPAHDVPERPAWPLWRTGSAATEAVWRRPLQRA